MTKTPNPAPMMCNSARSTVEWVERPTPLPSRAASRLRLESALALKPAEWGGAPPLLSRRAALAPLRAARYATSHNHQQPTTPRTYHHKTPSRHTTLWSRQSGGTCRLSRSRRRGRGRGRGRLPWRTAAAGAAASVRGATRSLHGGGGDGCVEAHGATRSARRVTRPRTGPVPPRAPRAAPRSHRGGGRRLASARARRPRRLLPRTARDAGRPLAGIASSCPRRPPPLGLEVARATVAAPPTGRRMRALDDGRARRRHASEPRRGMCEAARFSEVKSPSDVHFCPNRTISFPSCVNLRLAVTMVVSELQNKSTAKRQAQRSRHLSGCTLAAQ